MGGCRGQGDDVSDPHAPPRVRQLFMEPSYIFWLQWGLERCAWSSPATKKLPDLSPFANPTPRRAVPKGPHHGPQAWCKAKHLKQKKGTSGN